LILKGADLAARFSVGIETRVRVVNPDGGTAIYAFTRT
jgi:hypothetical protein